MLGYFFADAELFFQKKNELEELKLKRSHEEYLKTGKYTPPVSMKLALDVFLTSGV
jgi:hypothetical protein